MSPQTFTTKFKKDGCAYFFYFGENFILLRSNIDFEDVQGFHDLIEMEQHATGAHSTWFPISPFRTSVYHGGIRGGNKEDIIGIDVFGCKADYDRMEKELF